MLQQPKPLVLAAVNTPRRAKQYQFQFLAFVCFKGHQHFLQICFLPTHRRPQISYVNTQAQRLPHVLFYVAAC